MKLCMAKKTEAYVDTSALIAFADRSDTYHRIFKRLFADPPKLITSTLVIAEGHGWFLKRFDRTKALEFLNMIETMTPLQVKTIGIVEQKAAVDLLRKFSDQDMTLTDSVGLHLMTTHHIQSCWSTDFHLALTGVPLVIHSY
jgi:predicted nucleic acid-binding protein